MSSVSKPRVRQNRHKQGLNQTLEKISADFRYTFINAFIPCVQEVRRRRMKDSHLIHHHRSLLCLLIGSVLFTHKKLSVKHRQVILRLIFIQKDYKTQNKVVSLYHESSSLTYRRHISHPCFSPVLQFSAYILHKCRYRFFCYILCKVLAVNCSQISTFNIHGADCRCHPDVVNCSQISTFNIAFCIRKGEMSL